MVSEVDNSPMIQFSPADLGSIQRPHNNALIITATIADYDVARTFIDVGSSIDIIFLECFECMNLEAELLPVEITLYGFSGRSVQPLGQIVLPLALRTTLTLKRRMVRFLVVDGPSSYNVILGRPMLNQFQTVVSTFHMKLKFLVGEVVGDQFSVRKYYVESIRMANALGLSNIDKPKGKEKQDKKN